LNSRENPLDDCAPAGAATLNASNTAPASLPLVRKTPSLLGLDPALSPERRILSQGPDSKARSCHVALAADGKAAEQR
jgi:hypothetical protein